MYDLLTLLNSLPSQRLIDRDRALVCLHLFGGKKASAKIQYNLWCCINCNDDFAFFLLFEVSCTLVA